MSQLLRTRRLLGNLLMLFSVIMLPPAALDLFYAEGVAAAFALAFAATFGAGLAARASARGQVVHLKVRDGFVVVSLLWLAAGVFGALPFYLSGFGAGFTDALFESISGLTTTGATVYAGLDEWPRALLFYRHFLQWLGGLGIVVLAVAILPLMGVGGMQIYRVENSLHLGRDKLTPRITESAKVLWYIYLALTALCAACYFAAGMSGFDAVCHALSTVAIGGFSTHDANLGYFDSRWIEATALVFIVISCFNYTLHYLVWRRRQWRIYFEDVEARVFVAVALSAVGVTLVALAVHGALAGGEPLLASVLQTVSIVSTAGFTAVDYAVWPAMLPVFLLLLSFIGGCAGSTGGGVKVIRFWLIVKHIGREIFRLAHPHATTPLKVGRKAVDGRIVDAVSGFLSAYAIVFAVTLVVLLAAGLDQVTAFSAVAAAINNLGPGLGAVAENYAEIGAFAKWALCAAMLLGRLEILTLLVALSPALWRH